jgi:hypothetical protein
VRRSLLFFVVVLGKVVAVLRARVPALSARYEIKGQESWQWGGGLEEE